MSSTAAPTRTSTPRERENARRDARRAALAQIDFEQGRDVDIVLARDLKPGMVVSRLVYSYVTDIPSWPTDVVVSVEPSTVIVDGVQIGFSDTTSSGHGGDEAFHDVWVPFEIEANA